MKKTKAGSLTTRYVLAIGALLLVTNIVLGTVLMLQSTTAFRTLVRKNMLDLAPPLQVCWTATRWVR